ncbi:MAG: hypothetical protein PVF63_05500 [Gammaproteobacteria bacterium]|jgi:hypothetical protein
MNRNIRRCRRHLRVFSLVIAGGALGLPPAMLAQDSDAAAAPLQPLVSIRELMEKTITPATNTIWSYYEPPTEDSQWVELEEAAVTMLAAVSVNAAGGTGPMDNEWVRDPRWQAFNQVMLQASRDALEAIRKHDHAALLVASDILYPPCEGCHMQFNPGVVNAQ